MKTAHEANAERVRQAIALIRAITLEPHACLMLKQNLELLEDITRTCIEGLTQE